MVEKMKYVSLVGHLNDIDRIIDTYLCKYEIQLENSFKELTAQTEKADSPQEDNLQDEQPSGENAYIETFNVVNPYRATQAKAERIMKLTGFTASKDTNISRERAVEIIELTNEKYQQRDDTLKKLEEKHTMYKEFMEKIEPFLKLDFRIENLAKLDFIRYRFGKMPINNFKQFLAFSDDSEILFVEGKNDGDYIWALYFIPTVTKNKADEMLSSLHFERIWITYEVNGDPLYGTFMQSYELAQENVKSIENTIKEIHQLALSDLGITNEEFVRAYNKVTELNFSFDARKFAAKIVDNFYYFIGWMPESEAKLLDTEIHKDTKVIFEIKEEQEITNKKPPVKLRNLPIFKPFEFFIKMYGMPAHDEIDPTPFLAITYTILFGIMFGDLGQGIVLSGVGLYLYKKRKMALGAILAIVGCSSMFFGFMYGSIFGLEHAIPTLWMKPGHNLNTMILFTVVVGIILIYTSIFMNVVNHVIKKKWPEIIFSQNGLAGLLFYSGIMVIVVFTLQGLPVPTLLVVLLIVIPIVLMAFKEPIIGLIHGHKDVFHEGILLLALGSFIEAFEIVLGFFTNTVSFVRVGAFALSHAGMMSVVIMFAEQANGSYNPLVLILGNIFVIGLEGLVVAIQVLRLEFYEMFSRFVKGGGREFISYKNKK